MFIISPTARVAKTSDSNNELDLEIIGHTCYKSDKVVTPDSAKAFIRNIISRGHESVLEHASFTAKIVCDRGISHEIVRHRLASYTQESTRYANYSKDKFGSQITVIQPGELSDEAFTVWHNACVNAEEAYLEMLRLGCTPQIARSVLPTCLKTELWMTANLREWRTVFKLRCAPDAHPQIRELMLDLLQQAHDIYPSVFEDIYNWYFEPTTNEEKVD